MIQFHIENSGLNFIQPGINSKRIIVYIILICAVDTKLFYFFSRRTIVCNNRTRIAVGAQILSGIKTKRSEPAKKSDRFVSRTRAMRLSAIFNNRQTVLLGKIRNGLHMHGMTINMNGYNGFCFRGKRLLEKDRIHIKRSIFNIYKTRNGSEPQNNSYCGDKSPRGCNDFIARLNP